VRAFEVLWWTSFAAWLAATVLAWHRNQQLLQSTLGGRAGNEAVIAGAQPVTVALCLVVTLVPWWLVRRASNAGRWLAVVVAALASLRTLNLVAAVAMARSAHPLSTGLFALATVLDVVGVVALFRPEAAEWFAPLGEDVE
jgi:hypothetical protein